MRLFLILSLSFLITAGSAFAFNGVNPNEDQKFLGDINKVQAKQDAETKKSQEAVKKKKAEEAAAKQQEDSQFYEGVFLEGSFRQENLFGNYPVRYEEGGRLDITFEAKTLKNGNTSITYKAAKNQNFDDLSFDMETFSQTPNAPVNLFAVIKLFNNGEMVQESKIQLLILNASDLFSSPAPANTQPEGNSKKGNKK